MKTVLSALAAVLLGAKAFAAPVDPLPSWNDTASRRAIVEFVEKVTQEGSASYVPASERIATFDNDGTLWAELPMYFQLLFVLDRVKALAPQHPEWRTQQPFAALLKGEMKAVMAGGEKSLMALLSATHAGMTSEEFDQTVSDWLATARHPKTGKPFTEMVYQPMLELLTFLRANGFKTFIVSGGGIDFMRPWVEHVYGIPPEQVVGSSLGLKYELREGKPVLLKTAQLVLYDDKEGKPVGIQRHIGRRPIMAFGNSDGDFQMLEWTTAGTGPRFGAFVHHDDGEREYAYDRDSKIGLLARGLDEAGARGWRVISMKTDWKQIFPTSK